MEAKPQSVYIWGLFNGKEYTVPDKVKELEAKNIVQVASGGHFYLALSQQGSLYAWGTTKYNRYGLSGEDQPVPRLIPLKVPIKGIAAGNWHSLLIDAEGKVLAAGHNKQGACGVGSFENVLAYTEVEGLRVKKVACGDCVSLFLTTEAELYSCGHGELHGHKTKEHLNKPKKLDFEGEPILTMAGGFSHCLAVTTKGQTYSWGDGKFHQLGHGKKQDEKQPRLIKGLEHVAVVQVTCTRGEKNAHSMAVTQDGSVYTWGAGYKGKLGHEAKWSHENMADEPLPRKMETIDYKVRAASAGGIHSSILNEEGEVLSFGCGSNGRLGHEKSSEYTYLYREGFPKRIDSLKGVFVTELQSSYYHNICLGFRRE